LGRRTHILDQDRDQGLSIAAQVAGLMGAELGWSEPEQARQIARYRQVVEGTRRWRS
jgi:glycerol-3-phosphate dehydrogenase